MGDRVNKELQEDQRDGTIGIWKRLPPTPVLLLSSLTGKH
jgi:hypothetical protein